METILCARARRTTALLEQVLNMLSGIRGYLARRFSLKRKNPIITVPNTIKQMTFGLFQGNIAPPKSNPRRSSTVTARIESVPNQSTALMPSPSFVRGLCTSSKRSKRTNAIPQTGRLIQKHHRQFTSCVNAPPIRGPADPATAHTIPSKPMNKDRFRKLKRSEIVIVTNCIRPPPAVPCSARAAINIGILMLTAAIMLATVKIPSAAKRAGLRPQMSLHLAQMGPAAALASEYAPPIQM